MHAISLVDSVAWGYFSKWPSDISNTAMSHNLVSGPISVTSRSVAADFSALPSYVPSCLHSFVFFASAAMIDGFARPRYWWIQSAALMPLPPPLSSLLVIDRSNHFTLEGLHELYRNYMRRVRELKVEAEGRTRHLVTSSARRPPRSVANATENGR